MSLLTPVFISYLFAGGLLAPIIQLIFEQKITVPIVLIGIGYITLSVFLYSFFKKKGLYEKDKIEEIKAWNKKFEENIVEEHSEKTSNKIIQLGFMKFSLILLTFLFICTLLIAIILDYVI